MIHQTRHRRDSLRPGPVIVAAGLGLVAWCPPAVGQAAPAPLPYGVEVAFRTGHADRGFLISDRPVVQPVAWVSGRVAEFSVWSSFTLSPTTDSTRPRIAEFELMRESRWRHLTLAPALRMFFYRDPLRIERDRSIEGWLNLTYGVGPVRLFTHQSLDLLTYRGAYYGEAGIESERRLSGIEVGGLLGAGWASSKFNQAYAGVAATALDRVTAEGWLMVHLPPGGYLGPHVEFSSIVNPSVRAALARPSYVLIGLTTGVEF